MLDLYDEFRKLIAALDNAKIDYALCGGMAMAVYDHPRTTIDIDLLILSESLGEVIAAATELGYTIRGLDMSFANGSIEMRRVSKIDMREIDMSAAVTARLKLVSQLRRLCLSLRTAKLRPRQPVSHDDEKNTRPVLKTGLDTIK